MNEIQKEWIKNKEIKTELRGEGKTLGGGAFSTFV